MAQSLIQMPAGGKTFLNMPLVTDLESLDADIVVLGIPYGVPYDMEGVSGGSSTAPGAIRARSAAFGAGRFLEHYDFDHGGPLLGDRPLRIVDCGDVIADPLDIPGNAARATSAVRAILDRGALPIVLGGDDSIPIPFFRAYEGRGPLVLVQIDAHLDFRDELNGVSEGYSSPIRRASEMPWIDSIVQIGMRGVGSARPEEVEAALTNGNCIVPARDVHLNGVNWLQEQIPADANYLVTTDFDGFDPSVAPGVGAPVPGGLLFHQVADLLQGLSSRGRIAGVDLVEYVPDRDVNELTALVGARLLTNLIGAVARHRR